MIIIDASIMKTLLASNFSINKSSLIELTHKDGFTYLQFISEILVIQLLKKIIATCEAEIITYMDCILSLTTEFQLMPVIIRSSYILILFWKFLIVRSELKFTHKQPLN